eukprot:1365677-Alexandrium_andersonii.AAC.1
MCAHRTRLSGGTGHQQTAQAHRCTVVHAVALQFPPVSCTGGCRVPPGAGSFGRPPRRRKPQEAG